MKFTYLLIDVCVIVVPFLYSFHRRIRFDRHFWTYLPANTAAAVIFIAWDIYFTHKGVWGFNEHYITGLKFYNLPIEEVLFFFCIPFACLFTYHCLHGFLQNRLSEKQVDGVTMVLSFALTVLSAIYWQRAYTVVTFASTAVLLLLARFLWHARWLGQFYIVYVVLLVPFFIVNGILTGSGLPAPVVSYATDEIISLRIGTIPVEDIVYGFELMLVTVFFYHIFERRSDGIRAGFQPSS